MANIPLIAPSPPAEAKTCAADKDCPDTMGCCAMVDPGSFTAAELRFSGLPSTKSKVCLNAVFKASLDAQRTLKTTE